jgi:hypothetical protein
MRPRSPTTSASLPRPSGRRSSTAPPWPRPPPGSPRRANEIAAIERGEVVDGGLGKPMTADDIIRILKAAGWTDADIDHARVMAQLSEHGGEAAFETYLEELELRRDRAEKAVARAVLRRVSGDDPA